MLTVSAPGKVHLIGEHAVVYGEPAIIASIGMRTRVSFAKSESIKYFDRRFDSSKHEWDVSEVLESAGKTLELWNVCAEKKNFTDLFHHIKKDRYVNYRQAVVGIVLKKLSIESGISVEIESNVPVGSGLGSSSSLSVCLAKGIAESFGKKLSLEDINNIAYELEKIIHGTPSGGDNSASCFGGLTWFVKGTPNTIKSLKNEIPYKLENFVLVYTKQPEKTTGELVQHVRDKEESFRSKRVAEIGRATHEMLSALKSKDMQKVGKLMNLAQKNLAELGVSVKEIDEIASAVRDIGGAAKLCGAGGGGVMLCHHADKQKLVDTIKSLGCEPWETDLGTDGMRIEK